MPPGSRERFWAAVRERRRRPDSGDHDDHKERVPAGHCRGRLVSLAEIIDQGSLQYVTSRRVE
jgi:hypothetical protein